MSERLADPQPGGWPANPDPWTRALPAGTVIARLFPAGGPHPRGPTGFRWWGPTLSRFDHHPDPPGEHPRHGVLYGAIGGVVGPDGRPYPALATAMAEYYQVGRSIIPTRHVDWLAALRTVRPLRLLDLGDTNWLVRVGGNAAIYSGPREASRAWARAIYQRYPGLHGLVYPSSVVPPGRAVVLFERARTALTRRPSAWPMTEPALADVIERTAARIGYALIWQQPR